MDELTVKRDAVEMEIVVKFDVLTGQMSLAGCDKNPVIALGMLDYALARVRRFITMGDLQQEVRDASRVIPGSAFRQ